MIMNEIRQSLYNVYKVKVTSQIYIIVVHVRYVQLSLLIDSSTPIL